MINKMMGNSYKAESMETVEWREEASNLAYNYYMNLPSNNQAMGIGYGGFLARDIGHGFDAHNGILLLLIETGIYRIYHLFHLDSVILVQSQKPETIIPGI